VLEPGDFDAVFYDCLDDFGSFGGRNSRERLLAWERRLVDLSAAAFATAGGLESHLRSLRSHLTVHRAPNGVDLDWFRARAAESPVGRDRHEGRPVAGYVGVIGRWLDYDLLAGTLETCPEIDFVFVGPTTEGAVLERLQRHRNFRWVPRRPYAEIPGIISGFDACLIPFSEGPIARTTNPVKVFEYFALGKPVVTTAVDELREWRTGELVYWAEDLPGFSAAVRRAVHEHDPERAALRVDVARAHTWRERAAQMQSAMASVLTGGRSYDDPS
jgi:glycosyltransferase involved in cell wall biosynthesis